MHPGLTSMVIATMHQFAIRALADGLAHAYEESKRDD